MGSSQGANRPGGGDAYAVGVHEASSVGAVESETIEVDCIGTLDHRNIAEQSSEDRPLFTWLLNTATGNIVARPTKSTSLKVSFKYNRLLRLRDSPSAHQGEYILKPKNYFLARLIKRTSRRICSKSKQTIFWRNSPKAHHRKYILNPNK